jgi:hypothetical protein
MALPQGISITDFRHPPPFHKHHLKGGYHSWSGGIPLGLAEEDGVCTEPHGFCFIPFSVEIYGRLGQPAMKLLDLLGDKAAGPGGVTRASFVYGALRELSVGLCRGIFLSY